MAGMRLPHTRGDEPGIWPLIVASHTVCPTRVGMNRTTTVLSKGSSTVCPTRVGMNRTTSATIVMT